MSLADVRQKLAIIDLTSGSIEIKRIPEAATRAFLGGRGMNMYCLSKYLTPRIDPLGPRNVVVFGSGMLTGTLAPGASRWSVSAKSPEAYGLADASCGGFFGAHLRYAGYSGLVVKGRAPKPVYLLIEPDTIHIRPADRYWTMTTRAVQEALRSDLGEELEVACIGPAGERLVRFACIINGVKNAAARGGLGAVMGSKNLKALAVRGPGSAGIPIAHPSEFLRHCLELRNKLEHTVAREMFGTYGTLWLFNLWNMLGAVRTNNAQAATFSGGPDLEQVLQSSSKMLACSGCSIHCRHRNAFGGEGPDYSTFGSLGHNCGIGDLKTVTGLGNRCNELGLDASSAGAVISWAIELFERGLLSEGRAGRKLRFGDAALVFDLLTEIAERKGIGDVLAESSRAISSFGKESADFLIASKGLPQSDPIDLRFITSFALGEALSSRGADHLRSRPTADVLGIKPEFSQKVYGVPVDSDPGDYGTKHHLIHYHENFLAVVDSLGICKFGYGLNGFDGTTYEDFPGLIRHATGLELAEQELEAVGRRICNLERLINQREGLGREHDTLPRRYFDEPIPSGPAKGRRLDREKFGTMVAEYYRLRGWNRDGSLPQGQVEELERLRRMEFETEPYCV